jgi:hypothetical protein
MHGSIKNEEEFHQHHLQVVQEDKAKHRTRKIKIFFSFLFLSFVLIIVSVFCGVVFLTYQVFFTSLILWRGLHVSLNLSPILTLLAEGLTDITKYINLPVNLFYYAALPFLYLFEKLATIDLNLSSVNVTCAGSQAPIELLINCFILGLLVIIIRSDYQLLFNILLNDLNQRILLNNVEQRLEKQNLQFSRYFFICIIMTALCSINPFQVGLRYSMGFVRIDTFRKRRGVAHGVTESCDHVPGAPYFDSFLGYMSTIFAWWLILLYCLAEVVVPKIKEIDPAKKLIAQETHLRSRYPKIFPVDESVNMPSNDGNSIKYAHDVGHESKYDSVKDFTQLDLLPVPEFPNELSSKFPEINQAVLAQMYREGFHDAYKYRFRNTVEPSSFRKSFKKVTKKMPFIPALFYYCKEKYFLMISVDLWVSNLFSSWITVLTKNTMKKSLEEDQQLSFYSGRNSTIKLRKKSQIVSIKEDSVKSTGKLFSMDSKLYDEEQEKTRKKWEIERFEKNLLPSYYELCLIVRDELHDVSLL